MIAHKSLSQGSTIIDLMVYAWKANAREFHGYLDGKTLVAVVAQDHPSYRQIVALLSETEVEE